MKSFAFIVCPKTISDLKGLWTAMRILPDFIARLVLHKNRLFKVSRIKNIHSVRGKEIQGYFIICPLLGVPESKRDFILEIIVKAGHFAKSLGVSILGLISILPEDKEYMLANRLKIPLTNGNALGAWSIIEAIYRVSRIKKIDLKKSTVAIIGATGPIGKLCAKKMVDYAQRIIINDIEPERLKKLKELMPNPNPVEIIIEEDASKTVKDADVVIVFGYLSEIQNILEGLKPDTIVCYLGKLGNISINATIIEAGLIKLPYPIKSGLNTGLPKDIVSAALAETMLLTLEERFANHCLDDFTNPDKLEEIANIAVKHGLEVWLPQAPVL